MSFRVPIFKVLIDGNDVTSRFAPLVKSITVTKNSKRTAHTAEIKLADPDGSTFLPPDGAKMQIWLGHQDTGADLVFEGTVNDVNSSGARGSGRELKISATSADQKGKAKQPALRHKDKATLKDVATEWGQKAGLNVQVIGSLASVERDYWIQQNESFQAWGQRMAEENGATFQIIGNRAIFSPRNESMSASGKPLTPIFAAFGDNLVSWDISPTIGRPQYEKVQVRYYDREEAKWKDESVDVRGADAKVKLTEQLPAATKANASGKAGAGSKKSEREKGSGSAEIVGDYAAEPEAPCFISGARPGIDGEYIIDVVTHTLTKSDGFSTKLTIKKPTGTAGKDSRGTGPSSASSGLITSSGPSGEPAF